MTSLKRIPFFNLIILLAVGCWGHAFAQTPQPTIKRIYPSQKASVMQTIGVTDITITYYRPGVKGRPIFADAPPDMEARHKGEATLDNQNERKPGEPIVPYNHVWRAGANDATVFQVTDDVLINGQPLKAGMYSMHMIPSRDEWTIIFNNDYGQWGSFSYDAAKDALRVKTKAQATGDSQELLAYTFDPVTDNSATVNLRWEKMRVPFTVEVKDTLSNWRKHADEMIAANPTNDSLPVQAGNIYLGRKNFDEALKYANQSIKVKETFPNLQLKARALWGLGKKDEAIAAGDAAVAKGKADKANTTAFEKSLADWKTPKSQ